MKLIKDLTYNEGIEYVEGLTSPPFFQAFLNASAYALALSPLSELS